VHRLRGPRGGAVSAAPAILAPPPVAHASALEALPMDADVIRALTGASLAGCRVWLGAGVAHVVAVDPLPDDVRGDLGDELVAAGCYVGWLHRFADASAAHWVWTPDGASPAPVVNPPHGRQPWARVDDACELLRRLARHDRKEGVRAACLCAREALRYVPAGELRPLRAIETAEAWTRGEATIAQVRAARDEAWAADAAYAAYAADAADAAYAADAADAAAYAAYATAYAAYAAAYAAARRWARWRTIRRVELARLTDLVRLHHREPVAVTKRKRGGK
jgi:hypothetical protein